MACNDCNTTTTHPCVTPATVSYPCFTVTPCNDGCEDIYSAECVDVPVTTFFGNTTLATAITILSDTLTVMAKAHNTANPLNQVFVYRYKKPTFPANFSVTQNGILEVNATFTSESLLLSALQSLDPTWEITTDEIRVKGTDTWEVIIT